VTRKQREEMNSSSGPRKLSRPQTGIITGAAQALKRKMTIGQSSTTVNETVDKSNNLASRMALDILELATNKVSNNYPNYTEEEINEWKLMFHEFDKGNVC
jgi:hypothetical protein